MRILSLDVGVSHKRYCVGCCAAYAGRPSTL
nr:MAG TPA: Poxvirus A22 protein [Caudoviricetes sp.]